MAGVYWLGTDGNIWWKNGQGQVSNQGKPVNYNGGGTNWDAGFDTMKGSAEARRIADPNPGNPSAPTAQPQQQAPAYAGGGGGGAVAAKPDRSNDIAVQNAGLSAVDAQSAAGLKAIGDALAKLQGQYAEETAANNKNYSTQSDTNQNNYQKNRQTSLVNAAQGRQGLFGSLASIGALNGSGIDLANRAVQKGANTDLAGAADNYGTNQTTLDNAIGAYRMADKRRNEDATTQAENARTNVANNAAKSRMQFYSNLVGDYTDMGDKANATKYTQLASSLYPELAKTTVPNSNIAYTGAAFTPGSLSDYIAGADNLSVNTTPTQPGQTVPGLVASSKKKQQQQVLQPA